MARPLVLVQDEGGRLVLAAVDPAAAAAGLMPGLPLADARAQVPGLRSAAYEPAADGEALARLAVWCGRYTPWSALDPAGGGPGAGAGLLLDVTGCAHLFGGEAALLADLTARLARFGYTARAALADTPGAAWAIARFACDPARPWRVVPPDGQRAALVPLPPVALRLTPAAVELLARFGLREVGALFALAPAALEPRFGPELARRLRQALGDLPEPLSPLAPVPAQLVHRVLAEPVITLEAIAALLDGLAAALCRQLDARQLGARRLVLTVYRVDGTLRSLTLGTSRPTRDPAHLARLFAGRLEAIDPGFGIEVITLAAPRVEPLSALQLALGSAAGSARRSVGAAPTDLAALLDRLGARFGLERVVRPQPRESHLPERSVRLGPPLGAGRSPSWRRERPRPLRLLRHPEAIEAMALLPDHPPARFRWRRLQHRVLRAEGPERIEPEWWREGSVAAALARDYFQVEDSEGRRYWLYRAGDRWFLHGLFG